MNRGLADRVRAHPGLGIAVGTFLLVLGIAEFEGGYFPTSWGWCVLALAWVAGLALIVNARVELGRLELAFVGAIAAFVGLMALSALWTSDVDATVREVQRGLIYVVGASAATLLVRGRFAAHLLGGTLAAIVWVSAQALLSRLFPSAGPGSEVLTIGRLTDPIGYFNALGLFAAMGALLALSFAVYGERREARATAAAALPVLLTTTYFTFSRGGVLAIAVGLVAMIAIDPRRMRLLTVGPLVCIPAAVAVWLASRSPGLSSAEATRALISDEGPRLAVLLLALTAAAAVIALQVSAIEPRLRIPRSAGRAYGALLGCATIVLVLGVVVQHGGPGPLAREVYDRVNAVPQASGDPNDLNQHLASISNNGRIEHWRIALREHDQHPWLGSGAGTWEQYWDRYRPASSSNVRDAHSLYFEAIGQLGWAGLALVIAMLLVPLAGATRARRQPLVAVAFGVYVAYLVRTGIDWDWEVPAVTLVALWCGVVLVAAATDTGPVPRSILTPRWRGLALAAIGVMAAFSLTGLAGNRALSKAADANDNADSETAEIHARTAKRWLPWSADALDELGRAQVGLGERGEAKKTLRRATEITPDNWQIWYDLGAASRGRERTRAYIRAARLNPRESDIQVLRKQGRTLPSPPKDE